MGYYGSGRIDLLFQKNDDSGKSSMAAIAIILENLPAELSQ